MDECLACRFLDLQVPGSNPGGMCNLSKLLTRTYPGQLQKTQFEKSLKISRISSIILDSESHLLILFVLNIHPFILYDSVFHFLGSISTDIKKFLENYCSMPKLVHARIIEYALIV